MKGNKTIKLTAIVIAMIMLISVITPCNAEEFTTADESQVNNVISSKSDIVYMDYLASYADIKHPEATINVINNEISLKETQTFEVEFEVDQSGFYAALVEYRIPVAYTFTPVISLAIDGKSPYYEASQIGLPQIFKDVNPVVKNQEELPEQEPVFEYQSRYLFDTVGYYGGLLEFYLEKGTHTFTLGVITGSVDIKSIRFKEYDYPEAYKNQQGVVYSGKPIYFEAETPKQKSNSSIFGMHDASSPAVSPSSPYAKYLNTIGGSSWNTIGQYVEWTFTVPEDGLYNLAVKYRQNDNVGLNSYRRILIDGTVPFKELEKYKFEYSSTFVNETLSVDGEAMLFPLKKGEHTLRMDVVIGELSSVLPYINNIVNTLTDNYRQIVMVVGTSPDKLRDYQLETTIPQTLKSLQEQRKILEQLRDKLEALSGSSSAGTKAMSALIEQLKEFSTDSYYITKGLSSFKSNISSLSTWMLSAKSQPLKIDYFALYANGFEIKDSEVGFFESLLFKTKAFLFTFSSKYKQNTLSTNKKNAISLWVTGNATSYEITQQMIRDSFNKERPEIEVNVRLVGDSITNGILSGKGPDLHLGSAPTEVMNYAYRKQVVNLTRFDDFEEVLKQFPECAIDGMRWGDAVYGLPETQTMPMLFYRKDILEEMNLKVPQTWDDVIYVMAMLKKSNLEFGVPYGSGTFLTMMYQLGGTLYNDEKTATALTSAAGIEAFTKYTSFYTDYSAPISYNEQNRFRAGEMPILLANLSFYNTLETLAPEINGKWGIAPYPSTKLSDGTINSTLPIDVTGSFILNEEKADICWEFLKWWASTETQYTYSNRLEMAIGRSARRIPANTEALKRLGWNNEVNEMIDLYQDRFYELPNLPGSYFTGRHLTNALARVVYSGDIPGDALVQYSAIIDAELEYRREYFGLDKQ